jgi:hypothetical protein
VPFTVDARLGSGARAQADPSTRRTSTVAKSIHLNGRTLVPNRRQRVRGIEAIAGALDLLRRGDTRSGGRAVLFRVDDLLAFTDHATTVRADPPSTTLDAVALVFS